MYLTLLLPLVIPYGDPWTLHNPRAHFKRETEFFSWIESVSKKKYPKVPLLFSSDIETHKVGFIEGEQGLFPKVVPTAVTA